MKTLMIMLAALDIIATPLENRGAQCSVELQNVASYSVPTATVNCVLNGRWMTKTIHPNGDLITVVGLES